MRVVGIDPGLARTGYAVVEATPRGPRALAAGIVRTPSSRPHAPRLALLRAEMAAIMATYGPEVAAVERLFFNSNVKTAMAVGQAAGVVLATAAEAGIHVVHYTPTEVKQSVVGVGGASKHQVQAMVARILKLTSAPSPADAADACALAICHLNRRPLTVAVEGALG